MGTSLKKFRASPHKAPTITVPVLELGRVHQVPLEQIIEDAGNVRATFDGAKLNELAADIGRRGVEQPITIFQDPKGAGPYIIKHGARRYRAAKIAKLKTIPALVAERAGTGSGDGAIRKLFDQVAENFQRDDLNPIDFAHFIQRLNKEHNVKISAIPALLKDNGLDAMSRSHLHYYLNLLELPKWVQEFIQAGKLTPKHGMAIKPAMVSERVMHDLKQTITKEVAALEKQEAKDSDVDARRFSVSDLVRAMSHSFEKIHVELDTNFYTQGDNRTYYEPGKLSDENKKAIGLVSITSPNGYKHHYAMNPAAHKKLNAEARENFQKREKQQAARNKVGKSKSGTGKGKGDTPPTRDAANPQRLREHFHGRVEAWLRAKLPEAPLSVVNQVAIWLAFGAPAISGPEAKAIATKGVLEHGFFRHTNAIDQSNQVRLAAQHKLTSIGHFLNCKDVTELMRPVVENLVAVGGFTNEYISRHVDLATLLTLAKHIGYDLERDFRVTEDYLKMHTKAGLEKVVKPATRKDDQARKWLACRKTTDMRKFCIDNAGAIGVPADIRKLYDQLSSELGEVPAEITIKPQEKKAA